MVVHRSHCVSLNKLFAYRYGVSDQLWEGVSQYYAGLEDLKSRRDCCTIIVHLAHKFPHVNGSQSALVYTRKVLEESGPIRKLKSERLGSSSPHRQRIMVATRIRIAPVDSVQGRAPGLFPDSLHGGV